MANKQTKKGGNWSTVLLVCIFVLGVIIAAYPSISNWWNVRFATSAIIGYDHQVEQISDYDCDQLIADAQAYNELLSHTGNPFSDSDKVPNYDNMLRIPDTDVMGHITIKKIDLELPIYHGTDESVLAVGVGHLKGSSLPIGGLGTHSVLSAHRGLPSAKLFTSLDKLEVGDTFVVTTLKQKMTYRVDKISIVLPEETSNLLPVAGEDYCTLVTCTPYGVNTHRLLVRGTRIEGTGDSLYVASDAIKLDPLMVAPVVAIPMLILVVIGMIARSRRKEETDATS